jgi:anthranilate synthase component II
MILFIDRCDSFSENLFSLIKFCGEEIFEIDFRSKFLIDRYKSINHVAARNEEVDLEEKHQLIHLFQQKKYIGIVLSSGPGFPGENPEVLDLLLYIKQNNITVPIFGNCLGFQELLQATGRKIEVILPPNFHGHQKNLYSLKSVYFNKHWETFNAIFFNSLGYVLSTKASEQISKKQDLEWRNLVLDAKGMTCFGEHAILPWIGSQFHVESVSTPQGESLLRAFLQFCYERSLQK